MITHWQLEFDNVLTLLDKKEEIEELLNIYASGENGDRFCYADQIIFTKESFVLNIIAHERIEGDSKKLGLG